jgi:hypothetical protein
MSNTRQLWAARVMSGVAVLFLLFDATIKVLGVPAAVEGPSSSATRRASSSRWASCSCFSLPSI